MKKHARTIQNVSRYDLSDDTEYISHARMIKALGCNYLGIERRQFETDRGNDKVLRFLLYYFNDCPLAESVFPEENYKLHKNLLIVGDPGTG